MSIVERVWTLLEAVAKGASDEAYGVVRDALGGMAQDDKVAAAALKNNASGDAARALLARALATAVSELRVACRMDGSVPPPELWNAIDLRTEGAVLKWDAAAAEWVAGRHSLGESADCSAQGLLRRAVARAASAGGDLDALWAGWLRPSNAGTGGGSPVLVTVAKLLWVALVKPELEAVRAASPRHPGLALAVSDRLQPALVSGATLAEGDGEGRQIVARTGEPIRAVIVSPSLTTPALSVEPLEVLTRSAHSLGLLITHRAVRWIVTTAHARADRGDDEPRIIAVRGWADLAEQVGGTSKKDSGNLRDALMLLDRLRFDLPDGSTSALLSVRDWRVSESRGNPRRLEITVLSPLMPNYVCSLPRGQKRIVPLTELPPFVGRAQEHGNQAALQLAVLGEMSRRSEEIINGRGVCMTNALWGRLARHTGVPEVVVGRVRERWLRDGDDGPAFLRQVGREGYALAPAHHSAWEFLIDSGARRTAGKEAGKKSAEGKRKGRRGGSRSRKRGSK